jgi:uncharacterized membrane protein (UPF0127 family)
MTAHSESASAKSSWIRALLAIGAGFALVAAFLMMTGKSPGTIGYKFENPGGLMTQVFQLETATNDAERAKGLMYRRELAPDHGMIFVFPDDSVRSFWMKNTIVSLDMLFLDANMKVVGILQDVPTLNEMPRSVGKESRYVIELAAGTTRKFGIVVGSTGIPLGKIPAAS